MIISAVSSDSNCCDCGSDQIESLEMWHHTYNILRDFYLLSVLLGTVAVAAVNLGERESISLRHSCSRQIRAYHDLGWEARLQYLLSTIADEFCLVVGPRRASAQDYVYVWVTL